LSLTFHDPSLPTHFFFFHDTATTEIYTLSLHDALPIFPVYIRVSVSFFVRGRMTILVEYRMRPVGVPRFTFDSISRVMVSFLRRSEEHTSELQSRENLVCRLLLEKKK